MTNEEKKELLVALCGYLPYEAKGLYSWKKEEPYERYLTGALFDELYLSFKSDSDSLFSIYLRPMSCMTEVEKREFVYFTSKSMHCFKCDATDTIHYYNVFEEEDWLNAHHFDYRCLIERGLALEAPEGMYN